MSLSLFVRAASTPDPRNVLLARLMRLAGRPHLATWILEGADVEALKKKALDQIDLNIADGGQWHDWAARTYLGSDLLYAANLIRPEYFRTIDWLTTQTVNSTSPNSQPIYDMVEFANQYLGPVLMALKAKNKLWPNLKAKEFDWDAADEFVLDNAALLGSNLGPYDQEDQTVFDFGNGWRVVQLPADNVETEGNEMNNCLRDNDEYHWTDKVAEDYIAVLSLRDPLNRPHVTASVLLRDWENGNLIYTEGPLLKNNRGLEENPEYHQMWEKFQDHIQEKGGYISTGSDTWDEDHQPEPYHADQHDETEYGDYLSVEDIYDLIALWSEAKAGATNWGQSEDSERIDSEDYDGLPFYYYRTYGGREVGSNSGGLEQAVEEWLDDVETNAGTGTPLEMEPPEFVGAVVLWTAVLQDSSGENGRELLSLTSGQISQRAMSPSDEATPEARGMMAWAAKAIISPQSRAALQIDVPCADSSQVSLNWQEFVPVFNPDEMAGGWAEIGENLPWIHPEQLQVEPQNPQSFDTGGWTNLQAEYRPPQPPQAQGNPEGFQTISPTTRAGLVRQYQREWEQDPRPERMNEMGAALMNGIRLSPQDAASILQEVTGEEVGYRQAQARLQRMANGSTADYPEDWFDQTETQEEEEPWSPVPRHQPGEQVVFRSGGGGTVVGEPEVFEGGWWYRVTSPEGITYQAPEEALLRPDEDDQPGEDTLESLGIPPEGEQYYRTAAQKMAVVDPQANFDGMGQVGDWYRPVKPYVEEEAKYYHLCPACGGYLEKRGEDVYTCQSCPYELPHGGEHTASGDWDEMLTEGPKRLDDRRPFAFIYSPSEKWIKWTGPNGFHSEIENELRSKGEQVPEDALYGRYFPGGNQVEIYSPPFYRQPWTYIKAVESLIRLNAPDRP